MLPALHRIGAGLFIFFAIGTSQVQAALFEAGTDNLQKEVEAAKAQGKQLAIALTLPDCPGCLKMEKTVYVDKRTQQVIERRFRTVRLDISSSGALIDALGHATTPAELAKRLRVVATPSFLFFAGDGSFLYRHTGILNRSGLRNLADYVTQASFEKFPFTVSSQLSN